MSDPTPWPNTFEPEPLTELRSARSWVTFWVAVAAVALVALVGFEVGDQVVERRPRAVSVRGVDCVVVDGAGVSCAWSRWDGFRGSGEGR